MTYFVLLVAVSVSRLGDFESFWVANLLTKVAQIFNEFFGYYEKHNFK